MLPSPLGTVDETLGSAAASGQEPLCCQEPGSADAAGSGLEEGKSQVSLEASTGQVREAW